MASFYADPAIGGDGSTTTDDASPTTGLKKGGHRTRFVPALAQFVAMLSWFVSWATARKAEIDAAVASAVNAPGTKATVTGSISVGTGNKSFTLAELDKAFALGQYVSIARTSAPATTKMTGTITAFNPATGAMTVSVDYAIGTGSPSGWTVALAAASGVSSVAGLSGVVTATNLKSALAVSSSDIVDFDTAVNARAIAMAAALTS